MSFGFGRRASHAQISEAAIVEAPAALDRMLVIAALDAIRQGAPITEWPAGDLADALRAFAAELGGRSRSDLTTLVSFTAETAATATSVGWVTNDVRQVADSTSTIASAVEELASSISEMSAMSRNGAEDAVAARDETVACVGEMQHAAGSMDAIRNRVGVIGDRIRVLEDAVRQIAEMAGTIEAISSQTNLLALNATIEAARAGEAGRGFAVVANEVKSLSGQTAKATEQIRARIAVLMEETDAIRQATAESADSVSAGQDMINATRMKVEAVGNHVSLVTNQMHALAEVLGQQRSATNEISESVSRIAETARKTRSEIDDALAKLVSAETTALTAVDKAGERNATGYALMRAPADAAVARRRLASMLVGLNPPAFDAATFADKLDAGAPADLIAARDTIRREANRLTTAVKSQDWGGATDAFVKAEAALDQMNKAAVQAVRMIG
jgi:methyl-accepting chemotaxis protein